MVLGYDLPVSVRFAAQSVKHRVPGDNVRRGALPADGISGERRPQDTRGIALAGEAPGLESGI